MANEIVYLGHDNFIDLILKSNGTAVDLATTTEVRLVLSNQVIKATGATGDTVIGWAGAGYATGEVRLRLGGQTTIYPGEYEADLITYDSTNINGLVWGTVPIEVKSEVLPTT